MNRFFLSLLPPPALTAALTAVMYGIPGARWVPEDHLHLTLRFIGPTSPDRVRELVAVLRDLVHAPFSTPCSGVGTFPELSSRHRLNVLWARVEATNELLSLVRRVESCVQMVGFRAEQRPFHPHITLARIGETSPYDVERWLSVHQDLVLPAIDASAVHLMQSTSTPDGIVYSVLESIALEERRLPSQ